MIPGYNSEAFVASAIESVLAQSYRNFELILVDDGSADGTVGVMQRYAPLAVVLRHETNRGGNVARNTGLSHARGEYVAFLDSDDRWTPDKLEVMIGAMQRHPEPLLALSDFRRFEWDTGVFYALSNSQLHPAIYAAIQELGYRRHRAFVLPTDVIFRLLVEGYPPFTSTMVARRELFDRVGTWDMSLRRNQDFEFALRCARTTDFIYVDEALVEIGRHVTNVSADIPAQREGDIQVLKALRDGLPEGSPERRLVARAIGGRIAARGHIARTLGRPIESMWRYAQAALYPGMFLHAVPRIAVAAAMAMVPRLGHDNRVEGGSRPSVPPNPRPAEASDVGR